MSVTPTRHANTIIFPASLDPKAVTVVRRLTDAGFESYLVGGCVRDLLLGRIPKDFDVSTAARPRQIRRTFRNCRVIGRRFKLAHVHFGEQIIEVATFRRNPFEVLEGAEAHDATDELDDSDDHGPLSDDSDDSGDTDGEAKSAAPLGRRVVRVDDEEDDEDDDDARRGRRGGRRGRRSRDREADSSQHAEADGLLIVRDNVYGTAEEDALRRDFTINALLYDVASEEVIDYVGGVADLEQRTLRTIGEAKTRLAEDPVRMLRAVKFTARLGLHFDAELDAAMRECAPLIEQSSPPRVLEEIFKFLSCGQAGVALGMLAEYGLLQRLIPEVSIYWSEHRETLERIGAALDLLDGGQRRVSNAFMLAALFHDPWRAAIGDGDASEALLDLITPAARRMSIPRRDVAILKSIFMTLLRLERGKKGRRFRMRDFLARPSTIDAIDLLGLLSRAGSADPEYHARWAHKLVEQLGEEAVLPDARREESDDDPDDTSEAGERRESGDGPRKRKRRRRGGRGRRRGGERSDASDTGDRAEVDDAVRDTGRTDDARDTTERAPAAGRRSRAGSAEGGEHSRSSRGVEAAHDASGPAPSETTTPSPASPSGDAGTRDTTPAPPKPAPKPRGLRGFVKSLVKKVLGDDTPASPSASAGGSTASPATPAVGGAPRPSTPPTRDMSADESQPVQATEGEDTPSPRGDAGPDGEGSQPAEGERTGRRRRRRRRSRKSGGSHSPGGASTADDAVAEGGATPEASDAASGAAEKKPRQGAQRSKRGGGRGAASGGKERTSGGGRSRKSSSSGGSDRTRKGGEAAKRKPTRRDDDETRPARTEGPAQLHPEDVEDLFDW